MREATLVGGAGGGLFRSALRALIRSPRPPAASATRVYRAGARGPGGGVFGAAGLRFAPSGSGELRGLEARSAQGCFGVALRANDVMPWVRIMCTLCALALGPHALGLRPLHNGVMQTWAAGNCSRSSRALTAPAAPEGAPAPAVVDVAS